MQRRQFTAALAGLAFGGPLGEPVAGVLDRLRADTTPCRVGMADVRDIERTADLLTTLDLRAGGGSALRLAKGHLKWAAKLLGAHATDEVRTKLHRAVAALASRTAWANFDAGRQHDAHSLFRVALASAEEGQDPDLRAHILSDAGSQLTHLGSPDQCEELMRLAESDPRVSPAVRFVLHGVKAHAVARMGDGAACQHQVALAEEQYAKINRADVPDWMTGFLNDAHLYSVTGRAMYLAARQDSRYVDDARSRLSTALELFGTTRDRARALCSTRLAHLGFAVGDTAAAIHATNIALGVGSGLRSARIARDMHRIITAIDVHAGGQHPDLRQQIADVAAINAAQ